MASLLTSSTHAPLERPAPVSLEVGLRLAAAVRECAETPDALRVAAEVLSHGLVMPVATWVMDVDRVRLDLVCAEGLSDARHRDLVRLAQSWPLEDDPEAYTRLLVDIFRRVTRFSEVTAIDVGSGLLVLGGVYPDLEKCRAELARLLSVDEPESLILIEDPDLIDLTDVERVRSERIKLAGLTPREREVLGLLVRGAGTLQVSRRLGISAKTVKTHVQNILGKLDVGSRLEAVALATRNGASLRLLR